MKLSIFITTLFLTLIAHSARGDITDLLVNAYTGNSESGSQWVSLWVEFKHTSNRQPDAIKLLKVIAPDGTVIDMKQDHWEEFWKGFGAYPSAIDFDSGVIPAGRYTFRVAEKGVGTPVIQIVDTVQSVFLPPPSVTWPTAGVVVGSLNPTITWTAVPGAKVYRLDLWNLTWDEAIYSSGRNLYIPGTSFTVPNGVLRPGFDYSVRIRARDGYSYWEMDKESRSNWVSFSTP